MERNVSFKCNQGLSQFGYLYAVARPYSLSGLSRTTVVGYEVLRYRLDVEDIEGRNFVVRCPFGHAIANLTAADSATTPLQNALAHCIGSAEFCVVYLPDSVVQLRDIALDVACEPTSFLGSSLLSVMARERERWLSWWTLGGEFMFGLHDMCYGVRTCIGTHASFLLRICSHVICWVCCAEGDISTRASHIEHLSQAASLPNVTTVCETGFNQGFSALVWLASNPSLHVYSFDIMRYSGSYAALEFVQNNFPGRLTLIRGDSKHSIAEFASTHPDVMCDIILVDGLHTFDGALTDMRAFARLAHEQTVLFMDDLSSMVFDDRAGLVACDWR
jgi:hypothetical protein